VSVETTTTHARQSTLIVRRQAALSGRKRSGVDLAPTLGGATGDGAEDRVIVNGTNGDDRINVSGGADGITTSGLATTVKILHSEVANDRLELNTLAGTDSVNSAGLAAGAVLLFVDGAFVSQR
jgi:hypothetical protein